MAKSLIIVESPSKARTLAKYLGKGYTVKASVGHVKDLPTNKLGVDLEHDFQPEYVTIRGKATVLAEIKKSAASAGKVYLASDPDREGEAIAYHIAEELDTAPDRLYRIMIYEMTEKAIKAALEHPDRVDLKKVNAQQARRILDRIVGYKLSPLLWDKVRRGLSAGRVQSVAVRLVCEREQEIRIFVSEEYWSITAFLNGAVPPTFEAKLTRFRGEEIAISTQQEADSVLAALEGQPLTVRQVEKKEKKRNPVPPFTTSKLQQEAARKLRFTAKKTMTLAQRLYEGVELGEEGPVGLITYMRSDSVRVSPDAQEEARTFIQEAFGGEYLPDRPPVFKNRKGIQDAHEAIRPTSVLRTPEQMEGMLERDAFRLYKLIWNRFVASQMRPAILDVTSVDISAGEYLFRASGTIVRFAGFMKVYEEGRDESRQAKSAEAEAAAAEEEEHSLPPLEAGQLLRLDRIEPKQHFTQPPPRYTEASLIKELEEQGIGRPSTYATILSTIQDRKYVEKVENKFHPTELGQMVNTLLIDHFPELMDVAFTARMEEELDEIEEGSREWVDAVRDFYGPFSQSLDKAQLEMKNLKKEETATDVPCDKCGGPMVIKWGKLGHFLACSAYPECKNTKEFTRKADGSIQALEREIETTGETCPNCSSPMVVKTGRFGRFLACSNYPTCKTTQAIRLGVPCPEPGCGGDLVEKKTKKGKLFYSCNRYPKCTFAVWNRPISKECPECHAPLMTEKRSRDAGTKWECARKECGFSMEPPEEAGAEAADEVGAGMAAKVHDA
jgi:DNA topoisomerase-1